MSRYFCGIDIGSSYTKVVVVDENRSIVGHEVRKTGISFDQVALDALDEILAQAKIDRASIGRVVSTGVGRHNCSIRDVARPEITALAKGSFYLFPRAITIVDIGGQDNKVIKVGADGRQLSFKMNRKCAAGTGSFLEEVAHKLDLTIAQTNQQAANAERSINVGSFCTVFAATEIVHHIRNGEKLDQILLGVFESIYKRASEMDTITDPVVLTGGAVAHAPVLKDIFQKRGNISVLTPPEPQLVCAMGAAIFAYEGSQAQSEEDQ